MILTLVGLSEGTIEDSARRTRGIGADILIRPPATSAIGLSTAPIPEKMLAKVLEQPHVALVTGTVEHGQLFDRITGIDFNSFEKMAGGLKYLEGHNPDGPNQIVVDEYYARQHKLHAGDTHTLINSDWKIAGVLESGKGGRVFMPLDVLQDRIANPNKLSIIYVKADNPKNIPLVVSELKQLLPDNPIYTMEEFLSDHRRKYRAAAIVYECGHRTFDCVRFPGCFPVDVYGRAGAHPRDRNPEGAWRIARLYPQHPAS